MRQDKSIPSSISFSGVLRQEEDVTQIARLVELIYLDEHSMNLGEIASQRSAVYP